MQIRSTFHNLFDLEGEVHKPYCFDMEILIELNKISAEKLIVEIRSDGIYKTILRVDFSRKEIQFDRNKSDGYNTKGICASSFTSNNGLLDLRLISDVSSIEVFADEGKISMSNTIFPVHENQNIVLKKEGDNVEYLHFKIWNLDENIC